MKRLSFVFAVMMLGSVCWAQPIRLWNGGNDWTVDADIDRLWQYNRYEHSRWGLGIITTYTPHKLPHTSHQLGAWGGWGIEDQRLKGGLYYQHRTTRKTATTSIHLGVADDLLPAGRLYSSTDGYGLNSVVSNLGRDLMIRQQKAEATFNIKHHKQTYGIGSTLFSEQRLFDSIGLLYGNDARTASAYRGVDLSTSIKCTFGLEANIILTLANHDPTATMKAEMQYRKQWQQQVFTTKMLMQAGACSPQTVMHRRFNLGGSKGMLLATESTMATVEPNEFWTDAYTLAMIRVQTSKPLFSLYNAMVMIGMVPTPYASAKAVWGTLWTANNVGRTTDEGMAMQAPYCGLMEVQVGIDGLLRWGFSDWGMGVAMRIAPQSATYYKPDVSNNLAITLNGRLWL